MVNLNKYLMGKVLVMIDAANLESSVKDLEWWIDYNKLRKLFDGNELVDIRDYCVQHGTEDQNNFFAFLKNNGFTLITKPLKVIKTEEVEEADVRKADFDVEIAVDAMEMIDSFDTLVLFSGDSDFDYLLKNIQKKGKRTLVISTSHHVSRELIERSHKYIDLKKLRNLIERERD